MMQIGLDEIWLDKVQRRTGLDREKSRRLYRVVLVAAIGLSYLVDVLLYSLFAWAGTLPGWVVAAYGAAGLSHLLLFSAIHWFANVESRSDPQLVAWQMSYANAVQVAGMAAAPQLAPVFIGTTFIIFAFGSLRIDRRTAVYCWLGTFVAISAVLTIPARPALGIVEPTRLEVLLLCIAFALIALRTMLLGYYGSAMRMRLYQANGALARARQAAEKLAARDTLTGALSRRAIVQLVERALQRCGRRGTRSCVAMIDLDWFKAINDRFGHLIGDRVLQQVVELVQGCSRGTDVIGRYGGEEFLLLLQGANDNAAAPLVERIRNTIATADWSKIAPGLKVSVSCGIACTRANDTVESLLTRADQALYEAKRGGRDQLRVA